MFAYQVRNSVYLLYYVGRYRDTLFEADSCEANPTNGNNVVRATKS